MNPADKVIKRAVASLVPYARNSRTHSDEQVSQIMASIREWGWTTPVLITEDGMIVAGHGRVLAAQRLGLEEVPCVVASGWTEAQIRAYVIADNRIAENAGWNLELLALEIEDLRLEDVSLDLIGFDESALDELFNDAAGADKDDDQKGDGGERLYTSKISLPIYEPKGNKPTINEMVDCEKTKALCAEIDAAGLPDDVAWFLKKAADRHTVFHYRSIAEFYCHASPDVQDLMEKSGLVIIDFDKAIENGFIDMTERLGKLVENDDDEE